MISTILCALSSKKVGVPGGWQHVSSNRLDAAYLRCILMASGALTSALAPLGVSGRSSEYMDAMSSKHDMASGKGISSLGCYVHDLH